MATMQPPRPRPRPRPVIRHADNDNASTPGASSSSTSSVPLALSGKPLVIEVHDTDEMFMRNKNRTFKTWQKLDQINKDAIKPDQDDSSDSNEATPKNSKHKKQKKKQASSAWPNNTDITRLLSHDLSSDSNSDIEIVDEDSMPKGKRKRRQRSRSRSITPPPALPEHQIQNAKNVVRQTLGTGNRPPSPSNIDLDESTDAIIFQPELNLIAQEVAEQSHHANSQTPVNDIQQHIVLFVKWHPHPLDPKGQEVTWEYMVDRNDSFRDLFDATAEDAKIMAANLIMTYQGKRFFPSVTPAILKIWTDTAEFAAYDKRAYEYIQNNLYANAPKSSTPDQRLEVVEIESDECEAESVPQSQTQESEAESEAEGETFKLTLRSSGNKDITLTVRPTTKCGSIVKAFLKKHGIADQYPGVFADAPTKPGKRGGRKSKGNVAVEKDPRLHIDGEKMDNQTPIGDMDLEDGDMIEVVGL